MRLFRLTAVRIGTAAALFGLRVATYAADDPLAEVFARMDRASAKFKDLTADVRKVAYEAALKEETVDIGTIALKVPKRHDYHVLITFQQPDKKQVMIEGTKLVIYFPNSKIAQDMDLGKGNRSQVEAFLLLGFASNSKDLLDAYTVKFGGPDTVMGQKTTRIELISKSKDITAQFPKFELWLSDETGISVQQKMHMLGGAYALATYTNMKLNQNLPDSAVKLNLSKGVQREHLQK